MLNVLYLEIHLDSFSQVGLMIDALDLERNSSKRWRHREVWPGAEPNKAWAVTSWDLRWPRFLHSKALNCLCLWKLAASLRCVQRTFHGRFCITSHIISLLVLSQGTRPRIAQAAQRQWASLAWDPWMAAYCRWITAAKALLFFGKSWLIYIFNLINSLIFFNY